MIHSQKDPSYKEPCGGGCSPVNVSKPGRLEKGREKGYFEDGKSSGWEVAR